MARPKNITLQERVVAESQKKLARIAKMHEEMKRQVELEMQRLNEMREQQEQLVENMNSGPVPSLGPSASQSVFSCSFPSFLDSLPCGSLLG